MTRVLVIDDEDVIRQLLEDLLRDAGHEVLTASNGVEGLTCLQRAIPHLIITDMMMPVMDGIGFCRKVQAVPEYRIIPIVLLSAISDQIAVTSCAWAAVIGKPFDLNTLLATVTHLTTNGNVAGIQANV
jgi:two-component system, OmpR family, alkaline phosphatase synthesis response regulator PhoP